jgi:hypothetical protein
LFGVGVEFAEYHVVAEEGRGGKEFEGGIEVLEDLWMQ